MAGEASWALVASAALLGLSGGAHCVAMCGPLSGALCGGRSPQPARATTAVHALRPYGPLARAAVRASPVTWWHAGRLLGYAAAGAAAGTAMSALAWLGLHAAALKPLVALAHAAVLGWGLLLLCSGREPSWLTSAAARSWLSRHPRSGPFAAGIGWPLLPCGLLYGALLLAGLAGGPGFGALAMLAFGLTSGAWLAGASAAWRRWQRAPGMAPMATRLAGLALCAAGGFALATDWTSRLLDWCR